MSISQAVVVLLSPDDIGRLHPNFVVERDHQDEKLPTGQARQNVVLEAGMALARDASRVVLVEIGVTRTISDIAGVNIVRLTDDVSRRHAFAARLRAAHLAVNTDRHLRWQSAGQFDEALPTGIPPFESPSRQIDVPGGLSTYDQDFSMTYELIEI